MTISFQRGRMLHLAETEATLSAESLDRRRERRSAWLRVFVFAILVVNLHAGSIREIVLFHSHLVQGHIVAGYGLATLLALGLALSRRSPPWASTAFVVGDATMVVALFHEHLFAPDGAVDHSLTAPSLAVAFLLLAHVSLRLEPRLVAVFAGSVLTGWLSFLAIMVALPGSGSGAHSHDISVFAAEAALAATFGFAAYVCHLLTSDHNALLRGVVASERRRKSLARFFSPDVVSEIEAKGMSLGLARRRSTVMFVDLRAFTRLSETIPPEDLAALLTEYRQRVTDQVFAHGGTVDKFVGDAVMAVFGHPNVRPDDSARALRCALRVAADLDSWRRGRLADGRPALEAGIGLHTGLVIGGVVESGCHDEFTVLGDSVNVAQRLEGLTRSHDAALVVSEDVFAGAPALKDDPRWIWKDAVELPGRRGRIRIAVLPRLSPAAAA